MRAAACQPSRREHPAGSGANPTDNHLFAEVWSARETRDYRRVCWEALPSAARWRSKRLDATLLDTSMARLWVLVLADSSCLSPWPPLGWSPGCRKIMTWSALGRLGRRILRQPLGSSTEEPSTVRTAERHGIRRYATATISELLLKALHQRCAAAETVGWQRCSASTPD